MVGAGDARAAGRCGRTVWRAGALADTLGIARRPPPAIGSRTEGACARDCARPAHRSRPQACRGVSTVAARYRAGAVRRSAGPFRTSRKPQHTGSAGRPIQWPQCRHHLRPPCPTAERLPPRWSTLSAPGRTCSDPLSAAQHALPLRFSAPPCRAPFRLALCHTRPHPEGRTAPCTLAMLQLMTPCRVISSVVERFVHIEDVGSSNLSSPTIPPMKINHLRDATGGPV